MNDTCSEFKFGLPSAFLENLLPGSVLILVNFFLIVGNSHPMYSQSSRKVGEVRVQDQPAALQRV